MSAKLPSSLSLGYLNPTKIDEHSKHKRLEHDSAS